VGVLVGKPDEAQADYEELQRRLRAIAAAGDQLQVG
jgi:hypothetical protein